MTVVRGRNRRRVIVFTQPERGEVVIHNLQDRVADREWGVLVDGKSIARLTPYGARQMAVALIDAADKCDGWETFFDRAHDGTLEWGTT